jgi:hypothetical protein
MARHALVHHTDLGFAKPCNKTAAHRSHLAGSDSSTPGPLTGPNSADRPESDRPTDSLVDSHGASVHLRSRQDHSGPLPLPSHFHPKDRQMAYSTRSKMGRKPSQPRGRMSNLGRASGTRTHDPRIMSTLISMPFYANLYRSVSPGAGSSARPRWSESATVRTNSDRANGCQIVRGVPARHSLAIDPALLVGQIGHWVRGIGHQGAAEGWFS